jgi:calcineurin-like phosphoesterase family protein
MDETILDRLSSCVKTTDHPYFLGDFCIGGPVAAVSYRERIRCKKIHFIPGNHDKTIKKIADQFV